MFNGRETVSFLFRDFEPYFLTFLGRIKVPICAQTCYFKHQTYLVLKDGLKRAEAFRIIVTQTQKNTTIEFTSIKV